MRRPMGVLVALVLLGSASVAACSGDEPPAADATGAVEGTDVQASPQSLILELIRLREEGHPEDAARYFISKDYSATDELEAMTEVDASVLCTSSSVDCTNVYSEYVSGDECAGTTLEEAEAAGVEVPQEHVVEINGTSDYGYGCGFNIYQIGGQWWIAHG